MGRMQRRIAALSFSAGTGQPSGPWSGFLASVPMQRAAPLPSAAAPGLLHRSHRESSLTGPCSESPGAQEPHGEARRAAPQPDPSPLATFVLFIC